MSKLLSHKVLLPALIIIALIVIFSLLIPPVVLPAIEIAPEVVFHLFGFPVTNTLIASWISVVVLLLLAYFATRDMSLVPKGLQNVMEWVLELIYGLVESVAGPKWAPKFFPIVTTIFLYIIISNWTGILPFYGSVGWLHEAHEGAVGYHVQEISEGLALITRQPAEEGHGYVLVPFLRSAATDVNMPLALALTSVFLTQYFGIRALGPRYFSKFIHVDFRHGVFEGFVNIFVGLLELVSEFAKIISFTFRLFGNIFAGEVLLGVLAFLIPYIVSLPFYGLELFVGFVQALVFMMLSVVFFTLATLGHGEGEHVE